MRILLTNDDGINAQGLAALRRVAEGLGDVTVVAPDMERSGVAHSISLAQPLRIRKVHHDNDFFGHAVNGSPVDCVKLACSEILDEPPELLLSGINLGANAAINVLYSGTVAAAIEGAMLGIPSVAFSLDEAERPDFDEAGRVVQELLPRLLDAGIPPRTLLNVNIPGLPRSRIKGIRLSRQSQMRHPGAYQKRLDPWGRAYFWLSAGTRQGAEDEQQSDLRALEDGYVSVTPLKYDLTDYEAVAALSERLAGEWEE